MFFANTPSVWGWILNQGLAVAALVFLGWYAVKGITWMGSNFLEPLKIAAISHLTRVADVMENISRTLDRQQTELEAMARQMEVLDMLADRVLHQMECRSEKPPNRPTADAQTHEATR